jgi:Protein of unknown function (DUF732)
MTHRQFGTAVALAAAAITAAGSVAGTPVAEASNEQEFLNAATSEGYPGDPHTVEVGYQVCKLMDKGMTSTAIERYIADSVSNNRPNPLYEAGLFEQYAVYNLCPRHEANYGSNI